MPKSTTIIAFDSGRLRPGNRVKNDRCDAEQLALLYRAGALTAIHIPTEQEETARDLLRCAKTSGPISSVADPSAFR